MNVKLVQTVARASDGVLVLNDGSGTTIYDAYLSQGWSVVAAFQGGMPDQASFVLQHAATPPDQIGSAFEAL